MADYTVVDYNSWKETPQGLALAATLDKDIVLAEGSQRSSPSRWLQFD